MSKFIKVTGVWNPGNDAKIFREIYLNVDYIVLVKLWRPDSSFDYSKIVIANGEAFGAEDAVIAKESPTEIMVMICGDIKLGGSIMDMK